MKIIDSIFNWKKHKIKFENYKDKWIEVVLNNSNNYRGILKDVDSKNIYFLPYQYFSFEKGVLNYYIEERGLPLKILKNAIILTRERTCERFL